MSFNSVFGGSPIVAANPAYEPLTLSVNTVLAWPIETMGGVPYVAQSIDVTASVGGLVLQMPDATEGPRGVVSLIANVGANSFTLSDNLGNQIAVITASQQFLIVLTDNTTQAGKWRSYQLAATTSNANAAALAGLGLQAVGTQLLSSLGGNAPTRQHHESDGRLVGTLHQSRQRSLYDLDDWRRHDKRCGVHRPPGWQFGGALFGACHCLGGRLPHVWRNAVGHSHQRRWDWLDLGRRCSDGTRRLDDRR